jgi:uncharacterized protein
VIDAFCHILPAGYERARWTLGSTDFVQHSPAHIALKSGGPPPVAYEVLTNLEARFRMMDGFPGYRQVLSIAGPPPEVVCAGKSHELSAIANDEMAALVAKHPDRFAGAVAALPVNQPDRACREMERAVTELGLRGVQLFTSVAGKALDAPELRPLFETIARLRVPILLHPARSGRQADYPSEDRSKFLIWQMFGWPYESTAAMTRLVFSGMLEDLPDLKILVHHTAAMVPFFHGRMQSLFDLFEAQFSSDRGGPLPRPPMEYFRRFYADTSLFTAGSIDCARDFFGADQIVFGTDAPFDSTGGPRSIRDSAAAVNGSACTATEKAAIFQGNAERLFLLA